MREVAIVGIGMTPFGELWETPLRNLFAMIEARRQPESGRRIVTELAGQAHPDRLAIEIGGNGEVGQFEFEDRDRRQSAAGEVG